VPLRNPLITAVAHPTPVFTAMAPIGQFFSQAPHSMHKSRLMILAFLWSIKKTSCGHTFSHIPQPVHFSDSRFNVTTFFKYRISKPPFKEPWLKYRPPAEE
jgi:hypothetical protein